MVAFNTSVALSDPVSGIPEPKVAYVLYEVGGEFCAASRHGIKDGKLGVGQAVGLGRLSREFEDRDIEPRAQILPENLIAYSRTVLAWISKGRMAPMWFNLRGRHICYRVKWPHLLWVANRRSPSLRLFAMGSSCRPGMATRLYRAPLMNIGPDGVLCEGSARLPSVVDLASIEDIERCVLDSCFTHVNHKQTLKGGADDKAHMAYWRAKQRTGEGVRVRELVYWGRVEDAFRG